MPTFQAPCIVPGCYNVSLGQTGRCEEHQLEQYTSNRKARLPKDWNTKKNQVFLRDTKYCDVHKRKEVFCYLCDKCGADTVDHIIAGDDHAMSNLAAVHDKAEPHCHRYKTANEALNARKGNTPVEFGSVLAHELRERMRKGEF